MKNIRKTKVLLPVMLAAVALSAFENTPDKEIKQLQALLVHHVGTYLVTAVLYHAAILLHLKKSIQNSSCPKNQR